MRFKFAAQDQSYDQNIKIDGRDYSPLPDSVQTFLENAYLSGAEISDNITVGRINYQIQPF